MTTITGQIRLDFRSQEPIYHQIVRQMEAMVRDGRLKPGDQLPTVRQLAIDLRINFSTVARAYNILDEMRLISTQRGRGTYIWDNMIEADTLEGEPTTIQPEGRMEVVIQLAREFLDKAIATGVSIREIEAILPGVVNIYKSVKPENTSDK